MSKKTTQRIVIFTGILVVPVFFILLFSKATPKYSTIPYFGEHIIEEGDTTFYTVPSFTFNTMNGQVDEKDFEGKYLIVSFLYKTCPHDCNLPFEQFKYFLYNDLAKNKSKFADVHILSHVIGANPNELEELYKYLEIDKNRWTLATGDDNSIYNVNLLKQNPWTTADPNNGFEKGAYGLILLLDKQRHIRGVYQCNRTSEFDRLEDELVLVKREDDKLWYKK